MMTTVTVMTAQMNQEQMLVQIQSKMRAQNLPKFLSYADNNFVLCIWFSDFTVQVESSTCHLLALMMAYATVVMALMNGKELQWGEMYYRNMTSMWNMHHV